MKSKNIVNLPFNTVQDMQFGTVHGVSSNGCLIQGSSGVVVASQAVSCLVKPVVGDRVMYLYDPSGSYYILSILARQNEPNVVLSFPGDVIAETPNGSFTVAATNGIDMTSSMSINLLSNEIKASAVTARVCCVETQVSSESLTGSFNKIRLFSDSIDVVAERFTQRLKNCIRWVEQVEHVTVGQMIQTARNLFSVRARQSSITAKEDARIDGKRVHIG